MNRKIVAIGSDLDNTILHFVKKCVEWRIPVQTVNLRQVAASGGWSLEYPERGNSFLWWNEPDGRRSTAHLRTTDAIYIRPVHGSRHRRSEGSPAVWHALISSIRSWQVNSGAFVVNSLLAAQHNGSKALHEHELNRQGFRVPESLTSSDVQRLTEFIRSGPTILKTCSGVRANSRIIEGCDLDRYSPERGPLHVQRYISGRDVRVHVVSESYFATSAVSSAVDYRAAWSDTSFSAVDIPPDVARMCVSGTAAQGLLFAGWDFKVDDEGVYWCLECNPMPGYSAYDRFHDFSISRTLLSLLSGTQ